MASRIFRLRVVFTIVVIFHHVNCATSPFTNDNDNFIKPPPLRLTTVPLPITLPLSSPPNTLWAALNAQVNIPCPVQWSSTGIATNVDQLRGPDVTWLHDGKEIDGGTGNLTSASLRVTLTNVTLGWYECVVRYGGGDGEVKSSPVQLRAASLHEFKINPKDVMAEEGQPVAFFCSVNSKPAAYITWHRNNSPISNTLPSDRYVVLSTGTLVIKRVHSSDVGIYRCRAFNTILNKSRSSKRAKLRLQSKTVTISNADILATSLETNITSIYGELLDLYCFATSNPEPTIQWYKDGFIIGQNNILTILNITENHSGTYKCAAANNISTSYKSYNVNVLRPPYFNVTPTSVSFPSAKTVRFQCKANGNPTPKIYWLKNGLKLNYSGRVNFQENELLLSHSFSTDAGIYQCVAENIVGQTWSAARLSITTPYGQPQPPQNVTCRAYEASAICIQWSAPHGLSDLAYSVHTTDMETSKMLTELITNDTNMIIRHLNSNATYSFYVRGYVRSASDESQTVHCTTLPALVLRRKFTVELINANSAWLQWEELSNDTPCVTGVGDEADVWYRLQWRHVSTPSIYHTTTILGNRYLITTLIPSTTLHPSRYRFHVQPLTSPPKEITNNITNTTSLHSTFSKNHAEYEYTVPITSNNDVATVYDEDELLLLEQDEDLTEDEEFTPPYDLSAALSEHNSVRLSWEDDNVRVEFYTVCYAVVVEGETSCGGAGASGGGKGQEYKKSTTKFVVVHNLQQNTLYGFSVRAHAIDDITSAYSEPIQVNTKDLLSSAVQNLDYFIINASCVCVTWQQPTYLQNTSYTNYTVAYAIKQKKSENGWHYITVTSGPAIKQQSCYRSDDSTTLLPFGNPLSARRSSEMSLLLSELQPNLNYSLYVQSPGSNPGVTITISTKGALVTTTVNEEVEENTIDEDHAQTDLINETHREQILGAIVGVCISILLLLAVLCWFKICPWWRQRRANHQRRPTNMRHLNGSTDTTALTGNGQIHPHRTRPNQRQESTTLIPAPVPAHTNNNGTSTTYGNGVGMRSLRHVSYNNGGSGGRALATEREGNKDGEGEEESVELQRLLVSPSEGAGADTEDGRAVWRRRNSGGELAKSGEVADCIRITENPQYASNGNHTLDNPSTNNTPTITTLNQANNNNKTNNNCRRTPPQQFPNTATDGSTRNMQSLPRRQSPTLAPNG